MNDIKNMESIDEELILEFQQQEKKRITTNGNILSNEYNKICDDEKKSLNQRYGPQYIEARRKHEINIIERSEYFNTKFLAYKQLTIFEEEQMMKIAELQKNIQMKFIEQRIERDAKYYMKKKDIEMKLKETDQMHKKAIEDKKDINLIEKLKRDVDTLEKDKKNLNETYYDDKDKFDKEVKNAMNDAVYKDTTKEIIFNTWKESIKEHPRTLSYQYNVMEYQSMIDWAKKYKKADMKELWAKLADLFDESLIQKREMLHKYHLFQLSTHYPKRQTKNRAVWILFDCTERKVQRIEFEMGSSDINKIEIYSADELREEKKDNEDEDDVSYDWSNFNLICKKTFDENYVDDEGPEDGKSLKSHKINAWLMLFMGVEQKNKDVTFENSKTYLDFKNQRYLRIVFLDNKENAAALSLEQIRFYVQSDDKNEKDDDELTDGLQIDKYKLGLIDASDKVKKYWKKEDISDAYLLNKRKEYSSSDHTKTPYLIFDCETRKIEKFEIRFRGNWKGCYLKTFIILTSNTLSDEEEKWTEIFKDENIEDFKKTYSEIKTIDIGSKNERYLKFAFVLADESDRYYLNHLKFYTIDSDEYKWDIDQNIKNLTRHIKIVDSYDDVGGNTVDNIFNSTDYNKYRARFVEKEYNHEIEMRIRDSVCKAMNKLRNGGSISNNEKHFVKFLLCWQNKTHYDEILNTSKRVMNILSRPLLIEYKLLQDTKSKILTLKLDENHRLPKDIVSNHGLLQWDYNKWYEYRKAFFYPNDLKSLADEWTKLGLNLKDKDFKHLRRNDIIDEKISFTSSDELAMEYLNLIAAKLDPSFQNAMKQLFKENRNKLNLKYPTSNRDLGVLSGPIKTKARQNIKIKLDYFDKPTPQCMAVLDIVRCAIVCETPEELCNLHDLIVLKFSGKMLRVKNAFDDINKGTYGYRAVLMNIAYGDDKLLPEGYQMIVEVQLLLYKYYKVRKQMHLGYGICRSEEGGFAHKRQPYYVLAQDSCKFGKLDI